MTENLLNSARGLQPVWKRKLKRAGRAIQNWLRELIRSLIEITILFTITAVMVGILLSILEAFWYLYLETPVGIKYTADPARLSPHLLTQLFKQDLFLFSVEVAIAALTASLIISAAFQITALRRYFYVGRGLFNRVIVLLLFSAAAGFKLAHTGLIDLPVALGSIDRSEPVPVSIVYEYFSQNITRIDSLGNYENNHQRKKLSHSFR